MKKLTTKKALKRALFFQTELGAVVCGNLVEQEPDDQESTGNSICTFKDFPRQVYFQQRQEVTDGSVLTDESEDDDSDADTDTTNGSGSVSQLSKDEDNLGIDQHRFTQRSNFLQAIRGKFATSGELRTVCYMDKQPKIKVPAEATFRSILKNKDDLKKDPITNAPAGATPIDKHVVNTSKSLDYHHHEKSKRDYHDLRFEIKGQPASPSPRFDAILTSKSDESGGRAPHDDDECSIVDSTGGSTKVGDGTVSTSSTRATEDSEYTEYTNYTGYTGYIGFTVYSAKRKNTTDTCLHCLWDAVEVVCGKQIIEAIECDSARERMELAAAGQRGDQEDHLFCAETVEQDIQEMAENLLAVPMIMCQA